MHKSWAREEKNGNSLLCVVFCQLVHTDCFNDSQGNLYSLTSYDMSLFQKPCLPSFSLPTLAPLNSSSHLPLKHLIIPNFHFLFFFPQNAYTATAINSTNFCTSAKDAFVILVENALRVAAINTVGDFMLFLGKVRMLYTAVKAFHGSKLSLATTCTPRYKMPLSSCFLAWLYHI